MNSAGGFAALFVARQMDCLPLVRVKKDKENIYSNARHKELFETNSFTFFNRLSVSSFLTYCFDPNFLVDV